MRDTISDPWAYGEGSSEPQYIVEERPSFSKTCNVGHHAAWLIPAIFTAVALIVGFITKGA